MELSAKEKLDLLNIAKSAIEAKLKDKALPPLKVESNILKEKRGAFVTLKKTAGFAAALVTLELLNRLPKRFRKWLLPPLLMTPVSLL